MEADAIMKKITSFFILLAIFIFYIMAINFFASLLQSYNSENIPNESTIATEDSNIKLNVGNSIEVSVVRPRFYGTIYQKGDFSYIYVFNIFYLPFQMGHINFIWTHLIFIVFLLFIGRKLNKSKSIKSSKELKSLVSIGEDEKSFEQFFDE